MKKNLLILPLLITLLPAGGIKPKVIRANDGGGYRSSSHGGHNTKETVLLSTVEASSEISFQITSIVTLEATTEATSHQPRARRNYSEIEFLNNNRLKITEDISQGEGEHLLTLLDMMELKKDSTALAKIQSNFENLLSLEDEAFLLELKKINA